LKQKLYLGIDIWRKFELAPEVVGVEFLHRVESEFMAKGEPIEAHILSPEQTEQLEKAKGRFLTYESQGVGLTMVEHSIQLVEGAVLVNERFFPVSPAKQQLLFAEVDKMLRLGVIELSESPWNDAGTETWKE